MYCARRRAFSFWHKSFFFLFVSLLIAAIHDFQLQLQNYTSTFLNPCWQEYPEYACWSQDTVGILFPILFTSASYKNQDFYLPQKNYSHILL